MITKVIVKVPTPNHNKIMVVVADFDKLGPVTSVIMDHGEEREFYVHSNQHLFIEEYVSNGMQDKET